MQGLVKRSCLHKVHWEKRERNDQALKYCLMSLVTANVWEIGSKQFPFCFRNIYEWIDHCKKGNLEWFDKNDTYWRDRWEWDIGINRDIWFDVSLSTLPFFVIRRNSSFSKVMITINYIAVISRKDYLKDVKNFHLIYCCCIIY